MKNKKKLCILFSITLIVVLTFNVSHNINSNTENEVANQAESIVIYDEDKPGIMLEYQMKDATVTSFVSPIKLIEEPKNGMLDYSDAPSILVDETDNNIIIQFSSKLNAQSIQCRYYPKENTENNYTITSLELDNENKSNLSCKPNTVYEVLVNLSDSSYLAYLFLTP
jgi:hypothetical protein